MIDNHNFQELKSKADEALDKDIIFAEQWFRGIKSEGSFEPGNANRLADQIITCVKNMLDYREFIDYEKLDDMAILIFLMKLNKVLTNKFYVSGFEMENAMSVLKSTGVQT